MMVVGKLNSDYSNQAPVTQFETGAKRGAETGADEFQKFSTGAVRGTDASNTRFDLISPIALRKLAETCYEGAVKYNCKNGEPNWLKGIPVSDLLNHALRHIFLWINGDTTEPHLPHAMWNLMAAIHFEECRPDMLDVYPRKSVLENLKCHDSSTSQGSVTAGS